MTQVNGDVILWGEVRSLNDEMVLRFVSASSAQTSFRSLRDQTIRTDLAAQIAPAIAAWVAADVAPAYRTGAFVADTLRPISGRLTELLISNPPWLRGEARGIVLDALASAQFATGQQTSSRANLQAAVHSMKKRSGSSRRSGHGDAPWCRYAYRQRY
ncbi:MAG: hypothetical protein WDM79_14935 [Terricaulis sp.]